MRPDNGFTRLERRNQYHDLREAGGAVASELMTEVLIPGWVARVLLLEGRAQDEASAFSGDPKDAFDLAQNFVALQYTSFPIYALRQIQNLLWYLSVGFLLIVLDERVQLSISADNRAFSSVSVHRDRDHSLALPWRSSSAIRF